LKPTPEVLPKLAGLEGVQTNVDQYAGYVYHVIIGNSQTKLSYDEQALAQAWFPALQETLGTLFHKEVTIQGPDFIPNLRRQYYAVPKDNSRRVLSREWREVLTNLKKTIDNLVLPHGSSGLIEPRIAPSMMSILERRWKENQPSSLHSQPINLDETLSTIIQKNRSCVETNILQNALEKFVETFVKSKFENAVSTFENVDIHLTTSLCMTISCPNDEEWTKRLAPFNYYSTRPYKSMINADYDDPKNNECGLDIHEALNGVRISNISLFNIHRVSDLLAHLLEMPS
jgi:hypothetical protein